MQTMTVLALFGLFSCKAGHDLPTVDNVDLNRYMGTWYEIARLPNSFEKGLECITANYTLRPDGKVTVLNRGKSASGWENAKGIAKQPDKQHPGRIKVSFFRPFWAPYWIVDLDTVNYSYAMVGSPSRKYFWILSRTPVMDETAYNQLIEKAASLGFDTSALIKPNQNCSQP